jgi:hypothetical protein
LVHVDKLPIRNGPSMQICRRSKTPAGPLCKPHNFELFFKMSDKEEDDIFIRLVVSPDSQQKCSLSCKVSK